MHCKYCGAQRSDNAQFCPKCGRPIEKKLQHENVQSKDTLALIYIVLAVIVGALVWGIVNAPYKAIKKNAEPSVKEQVEEVFILMENGEDDLADSNMQALMEENQWNPEFYEACADMSVRYGTIDEAMDILLIGFEITEDEDLMDKFVDISLQNIVNVNDTDYEKLKEIIGQIAEDTDNTKRLERARNIYFYFSQRYY